MLPTQRDYGWAGRLGLGTPQANPTVEAEARRLIPASVEYFTVRLTSTNTDPRQRLLDYLQYLPDYVQRYSGLALDGFLFACTGSSYLVNPGADAERAQAAADQLGAPVILAADAIANWLQAAGSERIALLSPYPDWLHTAAVRFWQGRGFEVVAQAQVAIGSEDTYGIYAQQSKAAAALTGRLLDSAAQTLLISGTGMPSLPLIQSLRRDGRSVISSNFAVINAGLRLLQQQPQPPESWTFAPTETNHAR